MIKSLFCKGFMIATGALLIFGGLTAGCGSIFPEASKETKMSTTSTVTANDDAPYACIPNAIRPENKPRYLELAKKVKSGREEIKETSDGYALRFSASSDNIRDLAKFITYERACCPFLQFEMTVEKNGGSVWLNMSGGDEGKEILRREFAE